MNATSITIFATPDHLHARNRSADTAKASLPARIHRSSFEIGAKVANLDMFSVGVDSTERLAWMPHGPVPHHACLTHSALSAPTALGNI